MRFQKFSEAGKGERRSPVLRPHKELEDYLGKYCGLMLYLREMDEDKYSKICAVSLLCKFTSILVGLIYRRRLTSLRLASCTARR